jgi:protein tyrosine/serine phosphatase
LDLDGTANTRDLGGLPTTGGRVRSRLVLRSDNLQDLSAPDITRLIDEVGLRTVLDLRTDSERRGTGPGPLAGQPLVRHVALSFIPDDAEIRADPGAVLPDRWADGAIGAYLHYLRDRPDAFAAAVRTLASDDAGAAVLHCAAGKDRTGVLSAVILDTVGVLREALVEDFVASNERIEQIYDRLLGDHTYAADVQRIGLDAHRVDPATMHGVLDLLDEEYGGAAGYLRSAGVGDDELAALTRRLVQGG